MRETTFVQKKRYWILQLVIFMVLFSWTSLGFGQKISSFSAELIMLNPKGLVEQKAKIYVTSSKIRMDKVSPTTGVNTVMIFRRDRNARWILNSANKTYITKPLNEGEIETLVRQDLRSRSEKTLGTEMVSGYKCSKKVVNTNVNLRGVNRRVRSTVWVSPNLGIPIRTQFEDGSISELRNIKVAPLSESLFDLPRGYRQVSKMKELRGSQLTRQSEQLIEKQPMEGQPLQKQPIDTNLPIRRK